MYKKILPCMDIKNGKVVKGVQFKDIKEVGDILEFAKYYEDTKADEIAFYDIAASCEQKTLYFDKLREVKKLLTIPLIAGGGLNSVKTCADAFQNGADKVSINTGAIKDKLLLKNLVSEFGSQSVILSVDVKKTDIGYEVFTKAGKEGTGILALDWIKKAEDEGVEEVIVNSIDTDGMKSGYDLALLEAVLNRVNMKVVASGGAGSVEHFISLFKTLPEISTALGASVFHFKQINILDLKKKLLENGIKVKI